MSGSTAPHQKKKDCEHSKIKDSVKQAFRNESPTSVSGKCEGKITICYKKWKNYISFIGFMQSFCKNTTHINMQFNYC